jgi:hypothetical protein
VRVVTPLEGLERLRVAASSGDLGLLCRRYRISLLTVFGSAGRGEPEPRDLDIGALRARLETRGLGVVCGCGSRVGWSRRVLTDLEENSW